VLCDGLVRDILELTFLFRQIGPAVPGPAHVSMVAASYGHPAAHLIRCPPLLVRESVAGAPALPMWV